LVDKADNLRHNPGGLADVLIPGPCRGKGQIASSPSMTEVARPSAILLANSNLPIPPALDQHPVKHRADGSAGLDGW
jgi:hypothetical protein